MRISCVITGILLLGGCQTLTMQHDSSSQYECAGIEAKLTISDEPCDILRWFDYRFSTDHLSWPERKQLLAELGDNKVDSFKKVILSQSMDTPYQARLRAQNLLNELMPSLPDELTKLAGILLQQPAQKLLEYESALVTVGKINSRQSQTIEEQRMRVEELEKKVKEQHSQIEQLMKIETTLSNKDRQND
ncbi:hypothetical protein [Neptunicella sp.]|uniref:hypothetical protein n=1 Tax=Neptunicella sp. TaxID=2125986 RepID=UPI003F6915E9